MTAQSVLASQLSLDITRVKSNNIGRIFAKKKS